MFMVHNEQVRVAGGPNGVRSKFNKFGEGGGDFGSEIWSGGRPGGGRSLYSEVLCWGGGELLYSEVYVGLGVPVWRG